MSKQLTLPLEDYQKELKDQFLAGVKYGSTRLTQIVDDILTTGGLNLDISEDADPALISFIERVKAARGQKAETEQ